MSPWPQGVPASPPPRSSNIGGGPQSSLTAVDGLLVDDAALGEAVQVIQLHLLPGDVGHAQVHIPELLVLLLHPLVQSPGDLQAWGDVQLKNLPYQILDTETFFIRNTVKQVCCITKINLLT